MVPFHRMAPPSAAGQAWHTCRRVFACGVLLAFPVALATPAHADQPAPAAATPWVQPGATLQSVLTIARQLSPDLAARALDEEAARARVSVAGSLPDPTVSITSDQLDHKLIYSVGQDIPLWGKRTLRREAAEAEVGAKAANLRDAETALSERVRLAFALYYQSYRALQATRGLRPVLAGVARAARQRYAANLVPQQDVIQAEIETTRLGSEIARLEGSLRGAQGRLNALLLRPADAPLAMPQALPALPPPGRLDVGRLVDRAQAANPALAANSALIRAADRNAQLARRDWYPDISVSAGATNRTDTGANGYLVTIGVKLPLQWGLHAGQVRDTAAQAGAARARLDATAQQIRGDLATAAATLEASRRSGEITRRQLIPQANAALHSAIADYATGKIDLASVLRAERELVSIRIELLSIELDQQRQLAAIERLIGSDL